MIGMKTSCDLVLDIFYFLLEFSKIVIKTLQFFLFSNGDGIRNLLLGHVKFVDTPIFEGVP